MRPYVASPTPSVGDCGDRQLTTLGFSRKSTRVPSLQEEKESRLSLHSNYDLEFYVHDFPFKDTESLSEVSTHSGHREAGGVFHSSWAYPPLSSPPGGVAWVGGGWFGWVWFLPPSLFLAPRGVGFPFWGGVWGFGSRVPKPPLFSPQGSQVLVS